MSGSLADVLVATGLMDGDAVAKFAPLVDRLVQELGESPEAWRGANTITREVVGAVNALSIRLDAVPESVLTTITLLCGLLATHPLNPTARR